MTFAKTLVRAAATTAIITSFATSAMSQTITQDGADAHFAAQEWVDAASDYEALLSADKSNATNWFNLGASYQSLEEHKKAIKAYEAAIKAEYQPAVRVHYRLAQLYMGVEKQGKALDHIEKLADIGGYNFRAVRETAEFTPLKENARFIAAVDALRPCQSEGYRDFDFWLGHWDVTSAGNDAPTTSNKISNTYDGCVILEEYTAGFFTGTSLSFYDSVQGKWHQTWMSNAGGALYLEGGLNEAGAMVLTDQFLPISKVNESINRVTWIPLKDGTVRQHWQNSTDGAKTWSDVFDGTYMLKTE